MKGERKQRKSSAQLKDFLAILTIGLCKAKISESQKIYEMRDPFIENFVKIEGGYSGKLKTSYVAGPKITENDVIEIIKGKGLGEAQHDLRDIEGVASMKIDTSYPWVMSIPGDPNKITVILEVQE